MREVVREVVAPLVSLGVAKAMSDQPADGAAYLAQFIADRHTAETAELLRARVLGQEYTKLCLEAESIERQIQVLRKRVPIEVPSSHQIMQRASSGAAWYEIKRLKRRIREMKVKVNMPLVTKDWPTPTGVIVVEAAPGIDATHLCNKLAADFDYRHVDMRRFSTHGSSSHMKSVQGDLQAASAEIGDAGAVLLYGPLSITSATCKDISENIRRPLAVIVLLDAETPAKVSYAATADSSLSETTGLELSNKWLTCDIPQIEKSARQENIPLIKITCADTIDDQLGQILGAVSSI